MPGNTPSAQVGWDLQHLLATQAAAQKKEAAKRPELQAIMVPAGQGEALKAELAKDTKFPAVLAIKTEAGTDILLFTEGYDPEAVTYSVGDAGINVANVKKYVSTWADSADFAENIAKSGFWGDIWNGLSTAESTIMNALDGVDTPDEAVTKVEKIMTDLSSYLVGAVRALPTTAFKAEKVLTSMQVAAAAALAAKAEVPAEVVVDNAVVPAVANPEVENVPVVDPAVAPVVTAPAALDGAALLATLSTALETGFAALTQKMDTRLAEIPTAPVVAPVVDTTVAQKHDDLNAQLGRLILGGGSDNPDASAPAAKSDHKSTGNDFQKTWETA